MAKFLRINPSDNVAVAISDAAAGEECTVDGTVLKALADIPAGHKIALKDMSAGENVIKYGFPIGHLLADIPKGGLVDHNVLKNPCNMGMPMSSARILSVEINGINASQVTSSGHHIKLIEPISS